MLTTLLLLAVQAPQITSSSRTEVSITYPNTSTVAQSTMALPPAASTGSVIFTNAGVPVASAYVSASPSVDQYGRESAAITLIMDIQPVSGVNQPSVWVNMVFDVRFSHGGTLAVEFSDNYVARHLGSVFLDAGTAWWSNDDPFREYTQTELQGSSSDVHLALAYDHDAVWNGQFYITTINLAMLGDVEPVTEVFSDPTSVSEPTMLRWMRPDPGTVRLSCDPTAVPLLSLALAPAPVNIGWDPFSYAWLDRPCVASVNNFGYLDIDAVALGQLPPVYVQAIRLDPLSGVMTSNVLRLGN